MVMTRGLMKLCVCLKIEDEDEDEEGCVNSCLIATCPSYSQRTYLGAEPLALVETDYVLGLRKLCSMFRPKTTPLQASVGWWRRLRLQ